MEKSKSVTQLITAHTQGFSDDPMQPLGGATTRPGPESRSGAERRLPSRMPSYGDNQPTNRCLRCSLPLPHA